MGAKHTPGPWGIEKNYSNGCEIGPWIMTERSPTGTRTIVANLGGAPYLEDDGGANIYANARLIAAAPSLLEACRAFSAWDAGPHLTDSSLDPVRKVIYAAMAAAQGPTPPPVSGGSPAEELPPGVQALREVALAGIEGYDCRMQCWDGDEKIIDIITPDPADPMGMPRAIEGRRQHDEGWAIWRGQRRRDVP